LSRFPQLSEPGKRAVDSLRQLAEFLCYSE
jgi:protein CLEC16A